MKRLPFASGRRALGKAALGCAGLAAAGLLYFALARPVVVVPRLGTVPAFALVDQDGRPASPADLAGAPALFTFLPADLSHPTSYAIARSLEALQRRIQLEGEPFSKLRLVAITLQPGRDTPERLRAFASKVGANPEIWRFLTGSPLAVRLTVGTGFGVFYEERTGPRGPALAFDPRYVLVDGAGLIRSVYDGPGLDQRLLERDLRLLRQEAAARGARRLVYEAAHLFLCYPQ